MTIVVCVRHQLHIDGARNIGLPMAGCARHPHESEEDESKRCRHHARLQRAIPPARRKRTPVRSDLARWQRKLKRILGRARGDALHATGALERPNLQ